MCTHNWTKMCLFHSMGVSENNGTPKSSILIGFSIITIHFGVPLFWETPISRVNTPRDDDVFFVEGGVILLVCKLLLGIAQDDPNKCLTGWWFRLCLIFIPTWGTWSNLARIFFKWVGKKPPPSWMCRFTKHVDFGARCQRQMIL